MATPVSTDLAVPGTAQRCSGEADLKWQIGNTRTAGEQRHCTSLRRSSSSRLTLRIFTTPKAVMAVQCALNCSPYESGLENKACESCPPGAILQYGIIKRIRGSAVVFLFPRQKMNRWKWSQEMSAGDYR